MSDYICPYTCSYRTNSGFCGHTGGWERCQYRQLRQPNTVVGYVPSLIKTNFDRIRSMTGEELATVIAWPYLASPPWCANHTTCPYISEDPTPCDKCALDWLKEEASE